MDLRPYADEKYREFQKKLIPGLEKEIIGVRIPVLRKIAKKAPDSFLDELPHDSYDEDNLHALMINEMTDFEEQKKALEKFLPEVNNWATCDLLRPKTEGPWRPFLCCLADSPLLYTRRFVIVYFLRNCTDEAYRENDEDFILSIEGEEYYLKTAKAWYLQSLAVNRPEKVYETIREIGDDELVNMTVGKIRDSLQFTKDYKNKIKGLKKS